MRMAQNWKNNLCLIDAHGNVGSLDGDAPAASRYVEARLDKNATLLVDDLKYDTVDMVPNFDDTKLEPTVLPVKFPLCLINGTTGIAAGYATDIPPFNLNEVINACIYKLKHKNMNVDDLVKIIPGPDFPTGGYVIGKDDIVKALTTGRGKIVNSSTYHIEEDKKCNHIVITEIPFDTIKQDVCKEVNELNNDFILECRDESDKDGIRVVIDIDKNVDINTALNYVLKNSNFSKNYNFNMVAIVNKTPRQVSVLDLIDAWCEFRKEVIVKKYTYLLKQYEARKEIVEGLIKATSIMDKVIKVIKTSSDKKDVIKNLQSKFKFTENQATAIAEMRLYRLCNTDIIALKKELEDLKRNIEKAKKILSSDKEVVSVIIKELEQINKEFITPRRTRIRETIKELDIDETKLVQNEDVYVVATKDGYLKRMKKENLEQFLKEDDEIIYKGIKATHDYLVVYTNLGGYLKLQVHKIPECKATELGTHISKWVKCDGHKIIATGEGHMISWTSDAMIKTFDSNFEEASKMVKIPVFFKVKDGEVLRVEPVREKYIVTATKKNINFYPISEITETSLTSTGLSACKVKEGDELVFLEQVNKDDEIKIGKKKIKVKDIIPTHRGYIGQKY